METSPPSGLLDRALHRLLTRELQVTAIETPAPRFRLVELSPRTPQPLDWVPGMKLQISMGSVLSMRTYTPFDVDAPTGRLRILGYAHGSGPGSDWLERLRPQDRCAVFGPRRSLDLLRLGGPLAVFGDETSIGLACALQSRPGHGYTQLVLECDDPVAVQTVLKRLALRAELVQRGHDEALAQAAERLQADGFSFILTGRAASIQALRRAMRPWAVPAQRVLSKAYWAPGKTGMD